MPKEDSFPNITNYALIKFNILIIIISLKIRTPQPNIWCVERLAKCSYFSSVLIEKSDSQMVLFPLYRSNLTACGPITAHVKAAKIATN